MADAEESATKLGRQGLRVWSVALLGVLISSVIFLVWTANNEVSSLKTSLQVEAFRTALSLRTDRFKAFNGKPEEQLLPEYERLESMLQSIANIHPLWDGCFILRRHLDGSVYFLMDFNLGDSKFQTVPYGQVYADCPEAFKKVLTSHESVIVGPYTDAFGRWITAAAPVVDPATGDVLAAIAVDMQASSFNKTVRAALKEPAGFVVSLFLILIVWFVFSTYRPHRFRHLELISTLALGVVASLMMYWSFRKIDDSRVRSEFLSLANRKAETIVNSVKQLRDNELEELRRLIERQNDFDPRSFLALVEHFREVHEGRFWGWIPAVKEEDRAAFEMRTGARQGTNFKIYDMDQSGARISSPARPKHFPLAILYPDAGYQAFGMVGPGFDLASLDRFTEILKTPANSLVGASAMQPPVERAGIGEFAYLFLPARFASNPSEIAGYVVGLFEPQNLLNTALHINTDRNALLQIELVQLEPDRQSMLVLAEWNLDTVFREEDISSRKFSPWQLVQSCAGFGKMYAVIIRPDPKFFKLYRGSYPLLVLSLGILMSVLLALIVHTSVHRRERMQKSLDEKTASLRKTVEMYGRMARNSSTVSLKIQQNAHFKDVSDSATAIFGYTPEEMEKLRFFDLYPDSHSPEDMDRVFDLLRNGGGTYTHRHALKKKDGEIRWFITYLEPLVDDKTGERFLDVTSTDITAEHNAEVTLRTSENKYKSLVEDMADVIWEIDADSCRFTYMSPALTAATGGLTPEMVVGRAVDEVILFKDAKALARSIHEGALNLRSGVWTDADLRRFREMVIVRPDGRELDAEITLRYYLDKESDKVIVRGVTHDISLRKRLEKYHNLGMISLQILSRSDDFVELLKRLVVCIRDETNVASVGIRLRNGLGFPYVASAGHDDEFMKKEDQLFIQEDGKFVLMENGAPKLRCLCGAVLNGAEAFGWSRTQLGTIWTDDLEGDYKRLNPDSKPPVCQTCHFKSMIIAPIRVNGEMAGLLKLNSRNPREFSKEIIPLVELLAVHIGESMERRKIQNSYSVLFHEMTEAVMVTEVVLDNAGQVSDFKVVAVNPAFYSVTGCEASEFLNKCLSETYPSTLDHLLSALREIAETRTHFHEVVHSKRLERDLDVTFFPIGANEYVLVLSNVTERVSAENSLRESRRRYASLIANMPGMVYRCVLQDKWTVEFVSGGSVDVTGYSPEDFMTGAVDYITIIDRPYRVDYRAALHNLVTTGEPIQMEYSITRKDKTKRWVIERSSAVQDEYDRVYAIEGFMFDITERKIAEGARERFAMAMDQSRETIVITNENGVIEYANSAFSTLTGYDKSETIGKILMPFESPPVNSELYHSMWKTLFNGLPWEARFPNTRKDGTAYMENIVITPVQGKNGKIVNFLAVSHDITDELKDSQERESLREQLVQSTKMESIGRLAGGVAHDFNNMLQAILGYSEMAMAQIPNDQPVHADIEAVQNAARRAADLTRQLLLFARKSKTEARVIDVPKLLTSLTSLLRRIIGAEVAFEWNPPSESYFIKADPGHLDQLLTNLCINARDAIGQRAGGHIVLRSCRMQIETTITTLTGPLPPGQYAVITVSDNGCGIADEDITRIFEPFFTTKPKSKGTGLGLAMAYGIMKSCNGGICVNSTVDVGSSFELYFPICENVKESEENTSKVKTAMPMARDHNETILLVDDEETILYTTQRMLESLGYAVLSTASSQEALDIARAKGRTISLLLTDVIMPEMNGSDLVRNILEILPGLPYLYMSGYTGNVLSEQGIMKNTAPHIQKPFTRRVLATRIRTALDEKRVDPA